MKATLSAPCARTNSRIFCSRGLSGLCSQSASSPRTSEALFRHPTCPCPQPSNGLRGLSVVVRCDALRRLAPRRGGGRFWNPFSQITRKQRNGCKTYLRKKGGRSRSAGVECQPAQAALAKNQSGPRTTEATRSGEIQFHGRRGNTPGYSLLCSYCDQRATRFNKVVIAARKRFAGHKKELQGRQVEGKRGVKCTPRSAAACLSADSPSAGAAFSDIAPNIQYVQLTSAIVQRAQRMSVVLPDQGRKAPLQHTRRHACGILQSDNSRALLKEKALGVCVQITGLRLKRLFETLQHGSA
jgi:hypothetical protein